MEAPNRINDTLAVLKPEEVRDALWMVDVWQRWDMPAEEAAEWRRRILAHAEYVTMAGTESDAH